MCEWSVRMHGQNALDAPCLRLGKKRFFPTLKLIFSLNVHFVFVAMIFSFVIRLRLAVFVVGIVRCRLSVDRIQTHTDTHTYKLTPLRHAHKHTKQKPNDCSTCCATASNGVLGTDSRTYETMR